MQVKYFKDADGEIHGLINEVQDHLIKEDFVPLTKNELDRLFFPEKYLTEEEKLAYKRSQYPILTRYQFLRCLLENGYKTSDIEAQILTIEDEFTRELTLLGFKEATSFVRTDESVIAMQSILNLNDEKVDAMWEYALTL